MLKESDVYSLRYSLLGCRSSLRRNEGGTNTLRARQLSQMFFFFLGLIGLSALLPYGNCYGAPGDFAWKYQTGGSIEGSSPAIGSDGTVYIGSNDGKLYAVSNNGTSASTKWTYATGGPITSSPAIGSDGTVYIG